MKKIITISILLISIISFSQKKDSIKQQQIGLIERFSYDISSDLFKKKTYKIKLDEEYKLPWKNKKYTEEQLKKALDTLVKNTTINIKKGSFSNHILECNSYFPEFIDKIPFEYFKLKIKNHSIKNNNTKIKISKNGSSGFGSHFSSGFENGYSYSHNWRTIKKSFNIKTKINTDEFNGSVVFESGFINGYDYVKIKKSDIRKSFKIGNYAFTVIDIFNNSVILNFENDIEDVNFSLVNLNKKGEKITASGPSMSSQTIFRDIYLMFKENPNLSFAEYKKEVHPKFSKVMSYKDKGEAQEKIFGKRYVVFSSVDKLRNAYLYLPKYISKEFEIEYKKNQKEYVPVAPKKIVEKKINLRFEKKDEENGILIGVQGGEIKLLDKKLNTKKIVSTGTVIVVLGKTYGFYIDKKEDNTCDSYKYVKVLYEDIEYVVAGIYVYETEQIDWKDNIELLHGTSRNFLKDLKPVEGMEFCNKSFYSPIIIHNVESDIYSLVDVLKDNLYQKMTKDYKEADFFQSGSNSKIYDKITKVEFTDKGIILEIRRNGPTYKVLLTKNRKKYTAKYIE